MSTTKIRASKRGASKDSLTEQQQVFLDALLADPAMNLTNAATKAGYERPGQAGYKLMKHPKIQAALGKAKMEREKRSELKADDVLEYIHDAAMTDWVALGCDSAGANVWLMEPKDFQKLDPRKRRLILGWERTTITLDNGTEIKKVKLEVFSKEVAIGLAAKHTLVEQHQHNHAHFNFDMMIQSANNGHVDPVEKRLSDESRIIETTVERSKE